MEAWLQQWLSLLLRWAHFITGIAWIGASFYFNWLENHLQQRLQQTHSADPQANDPVAGDLWAVHGGGFYYLQKYRVAPDRLPEPLHWFKYEAYFTWITGLALLIVMYYWDARLFMLDPAVSGISEVGAIALGVAVMPVSWLVYDGMCRSPLRRHAILQTALIAAWFVLLAWALGHFLSGRAAFIHVGAAIGTVMVANVFFVIVPAQKELVAALAGGRTPDGDKGHAALLRSRHNNYLTLPVLFIMISSHYPASYSGANNWLFLAVFSLAAVGLRHWFNVRHQPAHSKWVLPASILVMVGLMLTTLPPQDQRKPAQGQAALATADVMPVIAERCAGCHSSHPAFSGITVAPQGIVFDTVAEVEAQAMLIVQAAVVNRTMPLGNVTAMSEAERAQLAQWHAARAQPSGQ